MKADASKLINDANQENRSGGGHNMYLCVGFSKIWREISIASLKYFVTLMVLTGYVTECPITGSQT